jgi:hypothetical protein
LRNNSVDSLTVTKAGAFTFPTPLRDGSLYSASVLQQPWGQKCWIYGPTGSGTIDGEDVTDILVNCVNFCEAGVGVVPRPGDYAAAQANCRAPVLVDNGDGTVSDLSNNLVWSRDVMHAGCIGTKFYSGGYAACFDLVLGGRDDWEVPDVAQLQTLLPTCGGSMTGCDGRFWSDSMPPTLVCCPQGGGCGRCHWIAGFDSAVGTLQDGSLGWVDIAQNCGGYTRCVTSLEPN